MKKETQSQTKPYLSVVVAARNDNYGGDFNLRLQHCIDWFCHYADKFCIHSEFIIVNYNPVAENEQLAQAITFPSSNLVKFKIITVPLSFHEKVSDMAVRKKVPLYEYLAKNIGIRRAQGEYIVSGNPDVLWDPSFFKIIAKGKLRENCYYRADRADYSKDLTAITMTTAGVNKIRKSVFHYFKKGFRYDISLQPFPLVMMAFLDIKNRYRLWYNLFIHKHAESLARFNLDINYDNVEYSVHTNASGDFFMMHKSAWYKLKGHPENTFLSIHTDAISIVMARYSGLSEKVFSFPVYHRDHARRFDSEKPDPEIVKMYRKFAEEGKWMQENNRAIIYNDDQWGFAGEQFEVTEI